MAPCRRDPSLRPGGALGDHATVAAHPAYDVVTVTWQHAATLDATLAAVAGLAPRPRQVLVVDNASADDSVEVAAGWRDRLPLTLLPETSNTGFAAAVNRALTACDSPWVLLLNPDCAPHPDFVAALLNGIAECGCPERVGAATGRLVRAGGPELAAGGVLDACGMVMTASGRHLDRGAGEPDDDRYRRPAWVFGGTGAATLLRRAALDDVAYPGGEVLAASLFAYREDAELAWRLQLRGWRCLYWPAARASHRRGFRPEAGRRGHAMVNRLSVRNRFLLRWHCADLAWHLRCLPWWLLRDAAVVGACLSVETGSLPALADLWRLRREATRRRRWVQSRRTVSARHLGRWFRRTGWCEELEAP